jgi:hypothetical protein
MNPTDLSLPCTDKGLDQHSLLQGETHPDIDTSQLLVYSDKKLAEQQQIEVMIENGNNTMS